MESIPGPHKRLKIRALIYLSALALSSFFYGRASFRDHHVNQRRLLEISFNLIKVFDVSAFKRQNGNTYDGQLEDPASSSLLPPDPASDVADGVKSVFGYHRSVKIESFKGACCSSKHA